MARYNEILAGRYNRFLQKLFAMKGGPPAPQLSGDIQPSFSIFGGVENRFLESWNRFGLQFTRAALAANTSAFRIRNPAVSNAVIVVESIVLENLNAGAISINIDGGPAAVDLATTIIVSFARLDARGNVNPVAILSSGNSPALISTKLSPTLLTNTTFAVISNENQEMTILPGDVLQIVTVQNQQQLDGGVIWRERSLEESERT